MRAGVRPVASAAFAAALKAKCGTLTTHEAKHLMAIARMCLPENARLRRGVEDFTRSFLAARFDDARQVELGNTLAACVEAALLPEPVGLERKDLHG